MSARKTVEDALVAQLPALRAYALSLTHNSTEADDLVHDAVLKAWTHLDRFEPGSNMRAWLFTILRNGFYSEKRRSRREVLDQRDYFAQRLVEKPAHDGRLQLADFRAAFATLPVEQREALMLVGAAGFSYIEAADMCGVALGTIKSRVARGRAHLAEVLHLNKDGAADLTDPVVHAVVNASPLRSF